MDSIKTTKKWPQFSLRFVFLSFSIVAFCLFVARNSHWISGLALFVSFTLFFASASMQAWRYRPNIRFTIFTLAALIAWFASIDRFISLEYCHRCESVHSACKYRFLGFPFATSKFDEQNDLYNRIATTLGKPCTHEYFGTPLKRYWGLMFCSLPCFELGIGFGIDSNSSSYTKSFQDSVARLGREDSGLASEFHEWLQTGSGKDYKYFEQFVQRLPTDVTQDETANR